MAVNNLGLVRVLNETTINVNNCSCVGYTHATIVVDEERATPGTKEVLSTLEVLSSSPNTSKSADKFVSDASSSSNSLPKTNNERYGFQEANSNVNFITLLNEL